MAASPALSLQLISASHGKAHILGGLALDVLPGETVAVTGPSGVGKTTLLRIIAGLHATWRGTLTLPGRIAMVFQDPVLMPWRTAAENLELTLGCTPDVARDLLAEVGLADLEDRYPGALSGGQQRRLSLARAFGASPDVLLMDEPFVSLDPQLADEMMTLFETLRAARPVATVLVTHSEAEARRLATRTLRLAGTPATVTAQQPPEVQSTNFLRGN